VYRSKVANDALQKGEEYCGDGMSAIRIAYKREVPEQFIH